MTDGLAPLAVVAGAGPGLGVAIARRFAREGMRVALISRNPRPLLPMIGADEGRSSAYSADVSDLAETARVMETIIHDLGSPAVLVYNGALWREGPSVALDPVLFQRDLALNVTSALVCTQRVAGGMAAQGHGTILFTGGGLSLRPGLGVGVGSLTAGKAALRALAHVLAGELAPQGLHVATVTVAGQVAPGTAFDPDLIADHYWALHRQARADWEVERVFAG